MANQPLNYMPGNVSPLGTLDINLLQAVGGNPRYFDYGRWSLLKDDSRLRGRVEGGASRAPGSGWYNNLGSGSVALRSPSGGGTPSNPGGYNYGTLQTTANAVRNEIVNPLLDKFSPQLNKRGQQVPRTSASSLYGKFRGKQQAIAEHNQGVRFNQARVQQQQQAQQQQSMLTTQQQYANMYNPSMNYSYAYQQAAQSSQQAAHASKFPSSPGLNLQQAQATASNLPSQQGPSINRPATTGGGFFDRYKNAQSLQPAPRKQSRAPKRTKPVTNTFDPSIW